MVTLRNFILASFGLFLLTQCNSTTDEKSKTPISISSVTQRNKNFIGEWRYNFPWYSSELILQDNGNFTFHDKGCYGQRYSQGQWTNENDILQLKSFDTFKQIGQAEKNIINDTEQNKTTRKSSKANVDYSFIGLEKIPPPVLPGPDDTVRVYFDKVQLQLTKDTLFCVGTNRLPEDAKFHKTKNNR